MVQRLSRHLPFTFSKKYISGPILVKLRIKHHQVWKGKGCMWILGWFDWNSGIYRHIMGRTLKIFYKTARSTAYRFMCWISVFLLCFHARMFIDALWSHAGKGLTSWSRLWCLIVKLSLSHWYPGFGVVLDCIDSWSLPFFLLCGHLYKSCCPCSWSLY